MNEDLQCLLEKINRDGIEKAQVEAERIVAAAKARADEIVKTAKAEAAQAKAEAEQASADYAKRAEESVGQAARDTILKVEGAVTKLLERLLAKDVASALEGNAGVELVTKAVQELSGPGEIVCGPQLARQLNAELAASGAKGFTVVMDETFGTGFAVKTDGGRVEHAFTGEVVAAELAKRLRPELAKLLKD